ncbi:MAG TPA: hypothetical protein VKA70_21470 [Blastocatellia bacterium]|nr:hypothetical protein [Blastocatellia bacterium]
MNIKLIAITLYGLFGALFLVSGAIVLLLSTGLLPDGLEKIILDVGRDDLNTLHIIQELGSVFVFAGLITFWFIRHYDQSMPFHWAMTTFLGLFALAHWFDPRGTFRYGAGQIIDTIPFILFILVGLLRKRFERKASAL